MPKAKLKIAANEKGKLINSAELADVKVDLAGAKVLGTEMIVVASAPTANLFNMGRYFEKVTNEVPKEVPAEKKK